MSFTEADLADFVYQAREREEPLFLVRKSFLCKDCVARLESAQQMWRDGLKGMVTRPGGPDGEAWGSPTPPPTAKLGGGDE